MTLPSRVTLVLVAGLLLPACKVGDLEALDSETAVNSCQQNGDCSSRRCDARFDACVSPSTELGTLLIEVVPPASVRGYGGLRFFQMHEGLEESSDALQLMVSSPTLVTGQLVATSPEKRAGCEGGGLFSVPTQVTFTPTQAVLGMTTLKYRATSKLTAGEQRFSLSLPAGSYDVYLEPQSVEGDAAAITDDCRVLPQLSRGISIGGASVELNFNQAVPRPLEVVLATDAAFEGWLVDVVHPVTGELLSNRAKLQLHQSAEGKTDYRANVAYSLVTGNDYTGMGQELVRLSPPEGEVAPVVLMHRAALEVFTPGQARIEGLPAFETRVDFQGWSLSQGDASVVAPGSVTFSAIELEGVPEGTFASFSVTTEVGAEGEVLAELLPGEYRVRTEPEAGSGFAASQSTLSVAASDDGTPASGVIEVPRATTIKGRVRLPAGLDSPVGAEVFADASRTLACQRAGGTRECDAPLDPVLSKALAEDPFVPRHAVGLVGDNARFTVVDVDCGGCTEDDAAVFDVAVRPPPSARLPYFIQTGLDVFGELDLGTLQIQLPVIQRGKLLVSSSGCGPDKSQGCVLPGALVRAYVLINDRGAVAQNAGLQSCALVNATQPGADERCAQGVLQVAEARANDAGEFELLLPPALN